MTKKRKTLLNIIFTLCLTLILMFCSSILIQNDPPGNTIMAPEETGKQTDSQMETGITHTADETQRTNTGGASSQKASDEPAIPAQADPKQSSTAGQRLLILVNEAEAIPEDYQVTPKLLGDAIIDIELYDALTKMIGDASDAGLSLWVASGYRSIAEQEELFHAATQDNIALGMSKAEARKEAQRTIQEPGHSEHHTGLAIDFNTVNVAFKETNEYLWLQTHAADYGFVQRYPADKTAITKIDEEAWHYRYVGVEHARQMDRLNLCLEEYLSYLLEEDLV